MWEGKQAHPIPSLIESFDCTAFFFVEDYVCMQFGRVSDGKFYLLKIFGFN
jgi:hypothetical protein